MLYDSKLEYEETTKENYELELNDVKERKSTIERYIVVFYNEENTIKKETLNLKNINDFNKEVILKYYVEHLIDFNKEELHCDDVGDLYHIYNLGYFYISDFYIDFKENINVEIKEKFENYDKNYNTYEFPFNDIEYLKYEK